MHKGSIGLHIAGWAASSPRTLPAGKPVSAIADSQANRSQTVAAFVEVVSGVLRDRPRFHVLARAG